MAIYHRCPQYTEKWEALRLGMPTASNFSSIITPTGKPAKNDTMRKYAYTLIAERICEQRMDTYMSPAMELGKMLEGEAITEYEVQKGVTVDSIGYVTDDNNIVGCSPDGLIGEDGILEVKCPAPHTQIGYFLGEPLDINYKFQTQGQLYVTGRKWCDLITYHPRMTLLPKIIRIERDEDYINILHTAVIEFNSFILQGLRNVQVLLNEEHKKIIDHLSSVIEKEKVHVE